MGARCDAVHAGPGARRGRDLRSALPRALAGDVDAMQELIEASAMANLACGNSGLGLVHALSSAPSVHLPHGYQNGVLLPHVARFNGAGGASSTALYAEIGFEARFRPGELSAARTSTRWSPRR